MFPIFYSEQVCQENMQLFATITERSPEAYIRANMVVAVGDLITAYPNIVEPWTQQIFQRFVTCCIYDGVIYLFAV